MVLCFSNIFQNYISHITVRNPISELGACALAFVPIVSSTLFCRRSTLSRGTASTGRSLECIRLRIPEVQQTMDEEQTQWSPRNRGIASTGRSWECIRLRTARSGDRIPGGGGLTSHGSRTNPVLTVTILWNGWGSRAGAYISTPTYSTICTGDRACCMKMR